MPSPAPAQIASAKPPAATPAPATAPSAPPVQMAAATTAGDTDEQHQIRAGRDGLPPGPQPALDAVAAKRLADDSLRVQVIAHATGTSDEAMEARRVSWRARRRSVLI